MKYFCCLGLKCFFFVILSIDRKETQVRLKITIILPLLSINITSEKITQTQLNKEKMFDTQEVILREICI